MSQLPKIVPLAPASSDGGELELEQREKRESARRARFISKPDIEFDPLHHRPQKTLYMIFLAFRATAIFQIWPTLLFFGGFSSMIVCLYLYLPNDAGRQIVVPTTMLTPLGESHKCHGRLEADRVRTCAGLGIILQVCSSRHRGRDLTADRTSSAYERYAEGRKLWAQITLGARTWARLVWIHCPDSLRPPPESGEPSLSETDQVRAIVEKRTIVQMGLAFAVAVKHYLRGEEGILYEDLYDLVRFFPSLCLPSGLPTPAEANIGSGGQIRARPSFYRDPSADYLSLPATAFSRRSPSPGSRPASRTGSRVALKTPETPPVDSPGTTGMPLMSAAPSIAPSHRARRPLRPAQNPPDFRWSETFPFKYLVSQRQRLKAEGRNEMKRRMREFRITRGVGQNVPLEVQLFMSTWIARMEQRKTIDGVIASQLLNVVQSFGDALTDLERILTTPIPFSYDAHIVEVMWVYCIFLPFQLVDTFRWVTVPATLVSAPCSLAEEANTGRSPYMSSWALAPLARRLKIRLDTTGSCLSKTR